ncbi:hypothetical protein C0J52_03489 [Blattella germanica]|nr:hypothetical protein C0J52_03489 [Blattella germanica]
MTSTCDLVKPKAGSARAAVHCTTSQREDMSQLVPLFLDPRAHFDAASNDALMYSDFGDGAKKMVSTTHVPEGTLLPIASCRCRSL